MEIPAKGFTHGAKFHADDVFATAFLRILNPNFQVERGFAVPEPAEYDGIIYDIGRGEFDHHQEDKEYRKNGCPYAAFGLVWRAFGRDFIGEAEADIFDESFIQPLDLSDNTGCHNCIADIIEEFNPAWDSEESYDACFFRAVDMAETILKNHFRHVKSRLRGNLVLKKAMAEGDGLVLYLDPYVPWKQEVIGSGYAFVVYPSSRGGYSAQGVPKHAGNNELICDFPKEWQGKDAETLSKISGIASLRFCHPNGFLCAAEKKEDAFLAARKALEQGEINK